MGDVFVMKEQIIVEVTVGIGGGHRTFRRNTDFTKVDIRQAAVGTFEILMYYHETEVFKINTRDLIVAYGYATQEELDAEYK